METTRHGRSFDARGRQVIDGVSTNLGFCQEANSIEDGSSVDEFTYKDQINVRDYWLDLDVQCPFCLQHMCLYGRHKEKYIDCYYSGGLLSYYDGAVPVPVPNSVLRQASYRFWFDLLYEDKDLTSYRSKRDLPRCIIDMVQGHLPVKEFWDQSGFEEEPVIEKPSDMSSNDEGDY